jgi:diguanylate cyclase (GGDEF)-like protein
MLDIDKFKSVNDAHGHDAGDAVIRVVARLIKAAARKTDLPARYGGEEMAIVLPNTPRQHASVVAETIRRALCARKVPTPAGELPITASFGVASIERGSPLHKPVHLIKAADLALYHAKNSGRNNVKVYSPKPATRAA